ncbi:MAG: ExbD/TolR family protein, partial [Pirellulaceae bacterium]
MRATVRAADRGEPLKRRMVMPLKLHQEETPTINLTSMIDVVFLLLIFFMVGTRFRDSESNIAIDLPRVSPTGAATDPG